MDGKKTENTNNRPQMARAQRAKQFAPFDALTGLHARLERAIKEHRDEMESNNLMHVETDDYSDTEEA